MSTYYQSNLTHRTSLTTKELQILLYFTSFRFLTVIHLQKLLLHKDKRYIKSWLHHLVNLGYATIANPNDVTIGKVAIYCLTQKAQTPILVNNIRTRSDLRWLYKEVIRSRSFMDHQLRLCDTYIFLKHFAVKTMNVCNFYTKIDMNGYAYLPIPKPDAMYSFSDQKDKKQDYLLYLLDSGLPYKVHATKIDGLIDFYLSGEWQENVSKQFPTVLLLCEDYGVQMRIKNYIHSTHIQQRLIPTIYIITNLDSLGGINKR